VTASDFSRDRDGGLKDGALKNVGHSDFSVDSSSPSTALNRPRQRIMIIDDDEAITDLVEIFLGRLGFRSVTVNSGMIGLAKAAKLKPDCILLDLAMPEFNGFTFLRARQKMPEVRDIPVVVLSASQMQEDVRCAIELGAVGYVTKPIDLDKLADRLDRILPSPYYSRADTSEISWRPER